MSAQQWHLVCVCVCLRVHAHACARTCVCNLQRVFSYRDDSDFILAASEAAEATTPVPRKRGGAGACCQRGLGRQRLPAMLEARRTEDAAGSVCPGQSKGPCSLHTPLPRPCITASFLLRRSRLAAGLRLLRSSRLTSRHLRLRPHLPFFPTSSALVVTPCLPHEGMQQQLLVVVLQRATV